MMDEVDTQLNAVLNGRINDKMPINNKNRDCNSKYCMSNASNGISPAMNRTCWFCRKFSG